MNTISNVHGAPTAAAQRAAEPAQPQPEQQSLGRNEPPEPGARFTHETPESPGRYWIERGENGAAVQFDPPQRSADEAPATEMRTTSAAAPEAGRSSEEPADMDKTPEKTHLTRCSADKVDQELEELRSRTAALKQQIARTQDDAEQADLQRELNAVSRELAQKDNDAYRRQHAQFTKLS